MKNWKDSDEQFVWHPFTQHHTSGKPLPVVRAEGTLLFDEEGNEYIDANSSWWVNVHGHGHPHIGAALNAQFSQLDHVIFAGVSHPKASELSERICALLPDTFTKVFFSDNGSTAVEVALKMAFQFWFNAGTPKSRVMAIEGAYHGDTFGAMSVGERDRFNRPFERFFFDAEYLPFPEDGREENVLQQASARFAGGEFAALIVEPLIQGASGMRPYSPVLLDRLVKLARENGVLVIFDEVMTGFGRTGKLFALEHLQQVPDIITLSKGLTGGVLPMGLTVATDRLFEAFLSDDLARGFLHGHSFTGNPLACAAACASLDLFEKEETWEQIRQLESWNQAFAEELRAHSLVSRVAVIGTILRFDIAEKEGTGYFSGWRDRAYLHFLKHGILLRPLGNTVFVNPPYCISHGQYTRIRMATLALLQEIQAAG